MSNKISSGEKTINTLFVTCMIIIQCRYLKKTYESEPVYSKKVLKTKAILSWWDYTFSL